MKLITLIATLLSIVITYGNSNLSQDDGVIKIAYYSTDSCISVLFSNGSDTLYFGNDCNDTTIIIKNATIPKPFIVVLNEEYEEYFPFYVHSGSFEININIDSRKIEIAHSDLNKIQTRINYLRDSIYTEYNVKKVITPSFQSLLENTNQLESYKRKYQQADEILSDMKYQLYLNNLSCPLILNYIYSNLLCQNNAEEKKKMSTLFRLLPAEFKSNATYKNIEEILKKDAADYPSPILQLDKNNY